MSPRAILVAIVIALTLIVAAAWLSGGEPESDAARLVQREEARPGSSGELAPALAEERAEATPVQLVGEVATAPRDNDVQPDAGSAESDSSRSILLTAREQGTEAPVAGAELALFEEEGLDLGKLLRRGALDVAAATRVLVADELGQVRVPIERVATVVFARKDELAGYLVVGATQTRDGVVPMVRDGDLRVEVVDLLGQPLAGVPVTMRRRQSNYLNDYGNATTDAAGVALLEHARMLVAIKRGAAKWSAAVRGVFDTPIEVPVDEVALDAGSVHMALGVFGTCDVLVRDERGEALSEPFDVVLDIEDRDSTSRDPFVEGHGVRIDDVQRGVAHFPIVQIGRPLRAYVRMRTSSVTHETSGVGPSVPGAKAELVIELAETACVITGRLVHADGRLPHDVKLQARIDRIESVGSIGWVSSVRLDDVGRFRISVQPQTGPQVFTLVVFASGSEGEEALSATHPLPALLPPSVIDVGLLTLDTPPLLAAGSVVDARGAAVPDVYVRVSIDVSHDGVESWRERGSPLAHTDGQGRFELRASQRFQRFRLVAYRDGATAESGVIEMGSTGIVLRMPVTGSLAGRVLLDEPLHKLRLAIEARRSDSGDAAEPDHANDRLGGDPEFELGALAPGEYDVRVVDEGQHTLHTCLARVSRVAVVADQVTRDPRLDPLDLRGVLRVVELSIVADSGERLSEPWAFARTTWPDGRVETAEAWVTGTSHLAVVCGESGVDLRAGAEGCAEVELLGIVDDREVVLHAAPRVVLTLPDGVAARDGGYRMGVQLVRDSFRPAGNQPFALAWFDNGPRVEVDAPAIGSVRVDVWIWIDKRGTNCAPIALDLPQIIEVAATGTTQVELGLTPAEIERALAALRSR